MPSVACAEEEVGGGELAGGGLLVVDGELTSLKPHKVQGVTVSLYEAVTRSVDRSEAPCGR